MSPEEFLTQLMSSMVFGFVAVFFLKKYVSDTDEKLRSIQLKFNKISEKLDNHNTRLTNLNVQIHEKLEVFRSEKANVSTEFLSEVRKLQAEFFQLKVDFHQALKEMKSTDKNVVEHFGKVVNIIKNHNEQENKIAKIEQEIQKIGKVIFRPK
jgi:hypothetical protein